MPLPAQGGVAELQPTTSGLASSRAAHHVRAILPKETALLYHPTVGTSCCSRCADHGQQSEQRSPRTLFQVPSLRCQPSETSGPEITAVWSLWEETGSVCESVNRCARLTGCWGEAVDWRGGRGGRGDTWCDGGRRECSQVRTQQLYFQRFYCLLGN